MSKYSEKIFLKSLKCALRGLKLALKSQENIKRQLIIALFSVVSGILLKFSSLEFCLLFIVIAMVLVTEIINSAIEFTIDSVFKNKFSKLAGMAKDMAAGAVCLASFAAVVVGILLFYKKIIG